MPPLSYHLRSLFVRGTSTLLTTISIGATVAVIAGVMALERGFANLYEVGGRPDIAVFMRPGANAEGESVVPRVRADIVIKESPEIARDAAGHPLAGAELYLAVRLFKVDGGETNVPLRGVQDASFTLAGDDLRITGGRRFAAGTDEVVVGAGLLGRIRDCQVGDTLMINTTPFKVVGTFDYDGPFRSEIWGDLDRFQAALERKNASRVIARLRPDADVEALAARLESDKRTPAKVLLETEYLAAQTQAVSGMLTALSLFLGLIMGTAAVFTGTNTMLAALAARTHEIGVLVALGFRPLGVFLGFLLEAVALGLMGGLAGCLMVLPLHGVETGTTNFQTFTEVAFAFRVTPDLLASAVVIAMALGMIGGLYPAWKAAHQAPTMSLRQA